MTVVGIRYEILTGDGGHCFLAEGPYAIADFVADLVGTARRNPMAALCHLRDVYSAVTVDVDQEDGLPASGKHYACWWGTELRPRQRPLRRTNSLVLFCRTRTIHGFYFEKRSSAVIAFQLG